MYVFVGNCSDMSRHQFIQEILVLKELEGHPNILKLIGCVTLSDPVCLVTEYAVNGDLLSYLQSLRQQMVCINNLNIYIFCFLQQNFVINVLLMFIPGF